MSLQALLLTLSAIFVVVGPITYIVSIAKGQTRPHRMTRFILAFVLTLNFVSIVAAGGNFGAQIFAGITFLQALVVFVMSLWRGIGGSSTFDWVCFVVAVGGIIGWKVTGNPLFGVWFAILADIAAYLPAIIKTYHKPKTESPWYYAFSGLAALLSLIAYKVDASSIFQIYIVICCIFMIGLIYRKEMYKKI
ncbi:MAG TPA: hypothetical protein VF189_03775 [Patescibacteria group bacterium]